MDGVEPVFVFILLGFPVAFVLIWTFVLGLISNLSGWSRLAATYRVVDSDRLKWTGWNSGRIGCFDMRSTLWLAMTDAGLYLKLGPAFVFKFAHPPLLIPWSKMEDVGLKQLFFRSYTESRSMVSVYG
ncbi:MAG: hypothetical protein K8F91_12155 [Candidatus Obscuribacterales bacterium]|nr:hypothetical protein [Candidatus Obscuribacterales bacterium]